MLPIADIDKLTAVFNTTHCIKPGQSVPNITTTAILDDLVSFNVFNKGFHFGWHVILPAAGARIGWDTAQGV